MKFYSSFSRLATTCAMLLLTACQSASTPTPLMPAPHASFRPLLPNSGGFRTASLVDPFSLPFQTTSFPAQTSISFVDGTQEAWSQANLTSQAFKLSRSPAGSLLLEVSVGTWPGGPSSYGLGFTLDFGGGVLEQYKPLKTTVDSTSMRTTSHQDVGVTLYHRFLSGQAEMVLRGKTLEVTITGLQSNDLTWTQCYWWGTGGTCGERTSPGTAITAGSATFTTEVPVEICDPNTNPIVLPSDLDDLLNQLKNLNLDSPDSLNQLKRLQQQLENVRVQLGLQGFSTQSFSTQATKPINIQRLLQKQETLLSEIEAAQNALQSDLQPLDNQLTSLVSLAENHYSSTLHRYEGVYRPLSFEQYKQKFDRAEINFYRLTHSRNTYDLLAAGFVEIVETQLYRQLIEDIRHGQIPMTHESDPTGYHYGFWQIPIQNTPEQLMNIMVRRLKHHRTKLPKLQAIMQRKLDKILVLHETNVNLRDADLRDGALEAQEVPDEFESSSSLVQPITKSEFQIQFAPSVDTDNVTYDGPAGTPAGGTGAPVFMPTGPGGPFTSPMAGPASALGGLLAAFQDDLRRLFNQDFSSKEPCPQPAPNPMPSNTPSPSPSACPPCVVQDGTIVPVGTVGYRFDILPDHVVQHGIAGSHLNTYIANQNPRDCKCFWKRDKTVKPPALPGWMPIQPFIN